MYYSYITVSPDTMPSERVTLSSCSNSTSFNNSGYVTDPAAHSTGRSVGSLVLTIMRGPMLFVGVLGFLANALVLFVLYIGKKSHRSAVNNFIMNQTLLDMLACLLMSIRLVLGFTGNTKFNLLTCIIIGGGISDMLVVNASIMSLVIITLERYMKIVHPICHRKYFHRWMIYAGVAICWIDGLSTCVISDFIVGDNCLAIPLNVGRVCSAISFCLLILKTCLVHNFTRNIVNVD